VEAGAKGYLLKTLRAKHCCGRCIRLRRWNLLPSANRRAALRPAVRSNIQVQELESGALAKGLTNKEIASVLDRSQYTVRNHINHISVKLSRPYRSRDDSGSPGKFSNAGELNPIETN